MGNTQSNQELLAAVQNGKTALDYPFPLYKSYL